jgi:serine protease AprX
VRLQPRASRATRAFARLGIAALAATSMFAGTAAPSAHALTLSSWFYVRPIDVTTAMNGITSRGGTVVPLNMQGGFLAIMPTDGLAAWQAAGKPGVGCSTDATPNALSSFNNWSAPYDPATDPHSALNAARNIGSDIYTAANFKGQGVDVALIDTGVAPVGDLKNVVIDGPDFSIESQSPALTHNDTNGHGTEMASIIHTVAPQARIISIKVGDSDGGVDVTQVMAAIGWVRQHAHDFGFNIKVLNLSYGNTNFYNNWQTDALSTEVDLAWQQGISVVVADGNNGDPNFDNSSTAIESPADNPNVMAVAAVDPANGTIADATTIASANDDSLAYKDDVKAPFSASSSRGFSRDPDFAAPGVSIAAYRVPNAAADNSVADEMCSPVNPYTQKQFAYPILGGSQNLTYIRGSGTSEAAAMTSGAVALMLSKSPTLVPDQVKSLLRSKAHSIPNSGSAVVGAGEIDLRQVYNATPGRPQNHPNATGAYLTDADRGGYHLIDVYSHAGKIRGISGCVDKTGTTTFGAFQPEGVYLCEDQDVFGNLLNSNFEVNEVGGTQPFINTPLAEVWKATGSAYVALPATAAQGGDANGFLTDPVLGKVWPSISWGAWNSWALGQWSDFYPTDVTWNATTGSWSTALEWRSPDGTFTGNRWSGNRWSTSNFETDCFSGNRWSGNSWREFGNN